MGLECRPESAVRAEQLVAMASYLCADDIEGGQATPRAARAYRSSNSAYESSRPVSVREICAYFPSLFPFPDTA